MKHTLLLLFFLPCIAFGQTTVIPDANFEQALIDLGYDTGTPDGSVPTANISGVDSLYILNKNISDLTGIEDFTALTYLFINDNLASLDISNNTALTHLDCRLNYLTSLDLSQNTGLTTLKCQSNQLTSLDLSGATALTDLWCFENQLTSLDVSGATALTHLNCSTNIITSLDVSQNTALTELYCRQNQLTSLDVIGAIALYRLMCWDNDLSSLDLSQNTALTILFCSYNQLTCLNVKNGNNYNMNLVSTNNPNLNCIEVDDATWSISNWTNWTNIDPQSSFSEDCNNACSGPPTADFTATSTNITEGDSITFADNSTNSPASWSWQFSGGVPSTSTNQNPVVTYNAPGSYDVVLIATNSTGSGTETKTGYITVSSTTTGIPEPPTKPKHLLNIYDLLGRPTPPVPNQILLYKYSDGSVEKRIKLKR